MKQFDFNFWLGYEQLKLTRRAHSQMVGFGSEQGLSDFETAGIASYVEKA